MSIRDGLEPSRSPDSETRTQPLPGDKAAPAHGAGEDPRPSSADETWPPSWGEAPSSWSRDPAAPDSAHTWTQAAATSDGTPNQPPAPEAAPSWTPPRAAQGPSWTQPSRNDTAGDAGSGLTGSDTDSTRTQPPPAGTGPSWTQPKDPDTQADPAQPGWGQGGGGYPTVPAWGTRTPDAGSPGGRRPSRWLAGVLAGAVLLGAGFGISQALDRNEPAGAGIPAAGQAPVAAAPIPAGEEPAAAVAKTLLPTVVEIRHGTGVGSGFIYDRDGYIMTAAHVVDGVDQVEVRLYDGTRLEGRVVGTDDLNDVGVVKVDRTGLPTAPLAVGQELQVGQLAIAIGSPFGLNETVTAGIVSSTDRVLEDGREVIQTDAPINPGNSGGVLADRRGRVIGINSAIRPGAGTNGNVGIGFAVPIDIAAKSATAIVQGRQIEIGYLGVTASPTTGGRDGALLARVAQDSPAEKAGLRVGDLVTAVDGKAVETYSEMIAAIRAHKPGDEVTLGVTRGGNDTTITATLTQRPAG